MSLVKTLQFASRFRKKMGMKKLRKPKKPGLRGGMWAKRSAINMAYGFKGLEGFSRFSKSKFINITTWKIKQSSKISSLERYNNRTSSMVYSR